MKLLALDTSSAACSAALMINNEVKTLFEIVPRAHSDLILSMCDKLLQEAKLLPSQLDGIGFGRGPGSFTGLRIAAGVTQGISFAANIPVIPVSSLAALAQKTHLDSQKNNILVAVDARMQEVYWGHFHFNEGKLMSFKEGICHPEALHATDEHQWFAAGDAWKVYHDQFEQKLISNMVGFNTCSLPCAENIAYLALQDLTDGNTYPPEKAMPVYLRNNVAKKSSQ